MAVPLGPGQFSIPHFQCPAPCRRRAHSLGPLSGSSGRAFGSRCRAFGNACRAFQSRTRRLWSPCRALGSACRAFQSACRTLWNRCRRLVQPCRALGNGCQRLGNPCRTPFNPCFLQTEPWKPVLKVKMRVLSEKQPKWPSSNRRQVLRQAKAEVWQPAGTFPRW